MGNVYNDINPYCGRILQQHIESGELPPGKVIIGDIRKQSATALKRATQIHLFAGIGGIPYGLRLGGWPDGQAILTAGFPCQPVSLAGKGLAQQDDRWLWPDVLRVLRVVRPRLVLLENVPGLLVRGMGDVLRDLAESGYDAAWRVVAASDVGAPHKRERVWVVAYPDSLAESQDDTTARSIGSRQQTRNDAGRVSGSSRPITGWPVYPSERLGVADGIPSRVDRAQALGNAVVPQCVAALVPWIEAVAHG